MTEWSMFALEEGLPRIPEAVAIGDSVPVAMWSGRRFAAVQHVQWLWSEAHDDDYLIEEVELFRRTVDGWEVAPGTGGSDWTLDPPLRRPPHPPDLVAIEGSVSSGGGDWRCSAILGVVGVEAVWIELLTDGDTERRPVNAPLGQFVVAWSGDLRATIRVLAADDRLLAEIDAEP